MAAGRRASSVEPGRPRDLRSRDFASPDAPAAGVGGDGGEDDLLPNRSYTSNLFWRLARSLDPQAPPRRILDLGPTSNANIQFWASRGFRVTCFDLFAREARRIAQQPISPITLAGDNLRRLKLPFPKEAFSAVCGWNIFARLPFVLAQHYARECYRLLCPSGLLHAIFIDVEGRLEARRQYHAADRHQLQVTSVAVPRKLPSAWLDAELVLMFSRFDACETLPAPCQTREVLAQRAPVDNFPGHRTLP